MKKSKTASQQKKDYEIVFKNTLDWCPLFGYMPEISNSNISKHPIIISFETSSMSEGLSTCDIARDCLAQIKEAREYWGVFHHDMIKNDPFPNVNKLPTKKDDKGRVYEYHQYNKKCKAARLLFQSVHHIAWGDVRFWHSHSADNNDYTSTINIDIFDRPAEALLYGAQMLIDALFNGNMNAWYGVTADEVYSLYVIYENWCLLVGLLKNKYGHKDEKILFDIVDYLYKLLDAAQNQREKQVLYQKVSKTEASNTERIAKATATKLEKRASDKAKIKIFYNSRPKNFTSINQAAVAIHDRHNPDMSLNKIIPLLDELAAENQITLPEKKRTGPKKINTKT